MIHQQVDSIGHVITNISRDMIKSVHNEIVCKQHVKLSFGGLLNLMRRMIIIYDTPSSCSNISGARVRFDKLKSSHVTSASIVIVQDLL